jgi:molecular chaperone GrpE
VAAEVSKDTYLQAGKITIMSAETNLPMDNQAQDNQAQSETTPPEASQVGQTPSDSQPEMSQPEAQADVQTVEDADGADFTLEPEVEPFDLSPEAAKATEAAADPEAQAKLQAMTQELTALKAELQDKSSQLDERNSLYMRIAADFENFRKRTEREREELETKIKCSTLSELLPVVDNFDRARLHLSPQTDGEENIQKSYQGIYKDFVDRLKRIGVSPMRAQGQEFDPNLHEAVMREPSSEYAEGVVIEEMQNGYMLGDRVLRHALVKVAIASDESGAGE